MKDKIKDYFHGNYQSFYGKYLQQAKRIGGDEYQALCPFHGDGKPSFSFNNKNGQYFCHGCNKKGDIIHFYAKLHNMDTQRDFVKILKGIASDFGIAWEEEQKKIVKSYDYKDRDGTLLFQVCRMEPKDFRQRRPDGKGGWKWDLKGVQLVPYRLPEILQAKEVIIVEGEKDVDNLMGLGFMATTNPMGAGRWKDEFNQRLSGKSVVLMPDNDVPGREHMTKIAMSLNGTTTSLKWLDLPGLPGKGDVSDFITSFGDDKDGAAERLAVIIQNAGLYTPPKKTSLEDIILTSQEFKALDLPERAQYLTPWLKEDSINLVSGWRGVGKTWFAWGVADAVTKGESFGPWRCGKAVPVLILDGEMPTKDLQERIEVMGFNRERPCPVYLYSDALANQHGIPRAHLASESWREKMKSILLARHIKLWIVDNLASLAGGLDENKKQDWDPINSWLLDLRFSGIATALLHHTNKAGSQRGTSAREDNIDCSIILRTPSDYTADDGCRFVVTFSKARVSTAGLSLISDMEFKLTEQEGRCSWTCSSVKKETRRAVLELRDEGMNQKAISEHLNISKGQVSKILKQAVNDGLVTKEGKTTQKGFKVITGLQGEET